MDSLIPDAISRSSTQNRLTMVLAVTNAKTDKLRCRPFGEREDGEAPILLYSIRFFDNELVYY